MTRPMDWRRWLEVSATRDVDPERGLRFENCSLVYQAVAEELGVGIAQTAFVCKDVAAGRLSMPFQQFLANDTGYFLVYSRERLKKPVAVHFCEWLREEARKINSMVKSHAGEMPGRAHRPIRRKRRTRTKPGRDHRARWTTGLIVPPLLARGWFARILPSVQKEHECSRGRLCTAVLGDAAVLMVA